MISKSTENKNKLMRLLMIGASCIAGITLLACGISFYFSSSADKEKNTDEQMALLDVSTEYVANQENMAVHNKTRNTNKEEVHILEIIPHDVCSVFPYMVAWENCKYMASENWGAKEYYDDNTPIGYEGILYMMTNGSMNVNNMNSTRAMLTYTFDGEKRETLDDYSNVSYGMPSGKNSDWWRVMGKSEQIYDGYFEYVGDEYVTGDNGSKSHDVGLYDIDIDKMYDVGDDSPLWPGASQNVSGIRYKLSAIEREANEAPKGKYCVNSPEYYWARDCETYDFVKTQNGKTITDKTDYNYELSFKQTEAGNYKVFSVDSKDKQSSKTYSSYDYEVELAEGVAWTGGYEYKEKGNYEVDKANTIAVIVDADTQLVGLYRRGTNSSKKDGFGAGFFELITSQNKSEIKMGSTVYKVSFEKSEDGSYILSPSDIMAKIGDAGEDNNSLAELYKDFSFYYVGKEKGTYDVSFMFLGSDSYTGKKYQYNLEKVVDGTGRYALTSSKIKTEELYLKDGDGDKDYSKLVKYIDHKDNSNIYYGVTENIYQGKWVFHTYEEDEEHGYTDIDDIKEEKNARIYVEGQKLIKCYYQREGFANNEWFKLLLYLKGAGDCGLAYEDYQAGNLTGQQIVAKYEKEIADFDKTHEIVIEQMTPSEVLPEDVEWADLIYISQRPGLGELANYWDDIAEHSDNHMESLGSYDYKFHDDFSAETLKAIYDNCLYHKGLDNEEFAEAPNTSLLLDIDDLRTSGHLDSSNNYAAVTNLGKLIYFLDFFRDPAYFGAFMTDNPERNDDYSEMFYETEAGSKVKVYEQYNQLYNLGKTYIRLSGMSNELLEKAGQLIYDPDSLAPQENIWEREYFVVPYTVWDDDQYRKYYTWNTNDPQNCYGGGTTAFTGQQYAYNQSPKSWWTWYTPVSMVEIFKGDGSLSGLTNIWKIIHQRQPKSINTRPIISVTNADQYTENITDRIYYYFIDEYDTASVDRMKIDFEVMWMPEGTSHDALQSVTVNGISISSDYGEHEYSVKNDLWDGEKWKTYNKQYTIVATDVDGSTDTVEVYFIIRESFMLN